MCKESWPNMGFFVSRYQVVLVLVLHATAVSDCEKPLMEYSKSELSPRHYNSKQHVTIENIDLGYVVDVAHHYVPGVQVILYTKVNSQQQHFEIEEVEGTEYSTIYHSSSGLYLQTLYGSELLHAGDNKYGWRSQWKVIPHGDNVYVIQNRYSEQVWACFDSFYPVDLGEGVSAGAVHLQDWVPNSKCQKWSLVYSD